MHTVGNKPGVPVPGHSRLHILLDLHLPGGTLCGLESHESACLIAEVKTSSETIYILQQHLSRRMLLPCLLLLSVGMVGHKVGRWACSTSHSASPVSRGIGMNFAEDLRAEMGETHKQDKRNDKAFNWIAVCYIGTPIMCVNSCLPYFDFKISTKFTPCW
jgi:hypothetical protein